MLEIDYADVFDKLGKVCDENKLEFEFETSKFPIVCRIRPNLEERDQLRIDLQEVDEASNFINGEIKLVFGEELTMTVLNDFKIEDSLLNKIKGLVKKLHYLFLQIYFKKKMI
jgi:hypothetical protein